MKDESPTDKDHGVAFDLPNFFPYQVRLFARFVSTSVEQVYQSEYDMKPYEWRALAILGMSNVLTPADLVARSSMDKVTVSRAISSLISRGWITSQTNDKDGRSRLLRTSPAGQKVFAHLVPKMKETELRLLSSLDADEARELVRLMEKVVGDARHTE